MEGQIESFTKLLGSRQNTHVRILQKYICEDCYNPVFLEPVTLKQCHEKDCLVSGSWLKETSNRCVAANCPFSDCLGSYLFVL